MLIKIKQYYRMGHNCNRYRRSLRQMPSNPKREVSTETTPCLLQESRRLLHTQVKREGRNLIHWTQDKISSKTMTQHLTSQGLQIAECPWIYRTWMARVTLRVRLLQLLTACSRRDWRLFRREWVAQVMDPPIPKIWKGIRIGGIQQSQQLFHLKSLRRLLRKEVIASS